MKITVLCENVSHAPEIEAEHGLSLFVESEGRRILFDMGQTELFARNATILGVKLSQVELAVLSHGHYDHGGGLESFFRENYTCHCTGEKQFAYLSCRMHNIRYLSCGQVLTI